MKRHICIALAVSALSATAAFAAEPSAAGSSATGTSNVKLSQAECTSLWQQANPTNAAGVSQSQASPYVSDFKAANPDGDATIDSKEWLAACNKGLVKASASTGASSGDAASKPSNKMAPNQ